MRRLRAAALSVCAAVLAADAWALWRRPAAPAWDDAWYLETSFRLYHALSRGPLAFAQAYASALRIKAPLLTLAPLPLYAALGASERVAAWVNVPLLALTWLFVYLAGRRLYGERAGLCAASVAAVIPLLYGLSRLFMVECLLTCLVCAAHWLILAARPEDRRAGWALGGVLGLGLLAKSTFPLYLAAAVWQRRRALAPHALRALEVAAVVAGSWYAFNLPYVVGYGLSAGFGAIGRDYGASVFTSPSVLESYATSLAGDGLSWPLTLCAALAVLALPRAERRRWDWGPSGRFWGGWLLVPLLVLLLGVNKDIRFAAPALPALAIGLGRIGAQLLESRGGALAALLLAPALAVAATQTLGVPAGRPLAYNGPGASSPWDRARVVEACAAAAPGGAVVAVALEDRRLNANNLASLAASRGYPLEFVNLGYAQKSVEGALIRLKDKGAGYVLLVDGVPAEDLPAFLNRADDGLALRLRSGRLPAVRVASGIRVGQGVTAELWRLASRS